MNLFTTESRSDGEQPGETTKGTKDHEGAHDHRPQRLVSLVSFVVSFGFLRGSVSPW